MRKTLFAICCLLAMTLAVRAQKMNLGVTAGVNLSDMSGKISTDGMRVGPRVGVWAELMPCSCAEKMYFSTGLVLSQKGYKSETVWKGKSAVHGVTTTFDVEIPFHVGYKVPLGERCSFLVDAGPYVSMSVCGKNRVYTDGKKTGSTTKIFGDGGLKRFDVGVGANVGMQFFDRYQVKVGYDFGLLNRIKDAKTNLGTVKTTGYNRCLNVSLVYLF